MTLLALQYLLRLTFNLCRNGEWFLQDGSARGIPLVQQYSSRVNHKHVSFIAMAHHFFSHTGDKKTVNTSEVSDSQAIIHDSEDVNGDVYETSDSRRQIGLTSAIFL